MAANSYTFKYTDDRNAAARLASISADSGGPMAVHKAHILAVALEGELPPPAGTAQTLTSHMMEDLSLAELSFEDSVMLSRVG